MYDLKADADVQVTGLRTRLEEFQDWFSKHGDELQEIAMLVEDIPGVSVSLSNYSFLDITCHGDKALLVKVIRAVMRSGAKVEKPADGPVKEYICLYITSANQGPSGREDGDHIAYINFSSTVCRRVLVRKEMQEVPVYEMVCGDGEEQSTEEQDA